MDQQSAAHGDSQAYERAVGEDDPFQRHIIGSGPVPEMLPYDPAEIDAVFRLWCSTGGRTNRFRQRIYRKRR